MSAWRTASACSLEDWCSAFSTRRSRSCRLARSICSSRTSAQRKAQRSEVVASNSSEEFAGSARRAGDARAACGSGRCLSTAMAVAETGSSAKTSRRTILWTPGAATAPLPRLSPWRRREKQTRKAIGQLAAGSQSSHAPQLDMKPGKSSADTSSATRNSSCCKCKICTGGGGFTIPLDGSN